VSYHLCSHTHGVVLSRKSEGEHFTPEHFFSGTVTIQKSILTVRFSLGNIPSVTFTLQSSLLYLIQCKYIIVSPTNHRFFSSSTFDYNNNYRHQKLGPITSHTVLTLDPQTGRVLKKWGKDIFYMPHGLTIDHHNNMWITDVARHQAFKFCPDMDEPQLIFGQNFEPGDDKDHLCKPTSVAVASTGEIFIADGYCNSRILKFTALGRLMRTIPSGNECLSLSVPHHTALIESLDRICVADRENKRVVCPSAELSERSLTQPLTIQTPDMGRIFGIAAVGEIIYAVNGPSLPFDMQLPVQGFIISAENETVIGDWGPFEKFQNPHAIAASPNTSSLYVVEIGPNKVWKFNLVRGKQ
ncbi:peptidyl-alpha-hydroxyglycine alpha-amidating lyase 2-like, partial [Photinus pyralis]|uniref:peptidyl-alpha-hydroxyglycine alpha-amidating lyase 2-like n=1 Tax=Photinus pyralis TaxID=7054 RepID=UPI0012674ADE